MTVITLADLTENDFHCYSDLHKECFGFRPRGRPTNAEIVSLYNEAPAILEQNRLQEEERLQRLRDKHGVQFADWHAYFDWKEEQDFLQWEKDQAERQAKLEHARCLATPGHPLVAIEAWEHGEDLALI